MTDTLDAATAVAIFKTMVKIRASDTCIQENLTSGDFQFQYYPTWGQEAIAATVGSLLETKDLVATTYRGIHDIIGKGTSIDEIFAELAGRTNGISAGKGGPMHLSDPKTGLMVTSGIVGGGMPIANGLALAQQMRDTGQIVVCNFGDGAANIGAFAETLNMAALWQLPVVFVCQNNLYAEYSDFSDSTISETLAGRGPAYGMPGVRIDGNDPDILHPVVAEAVQRARMGGGPTLIECMVHRLHGHAFGSDERHMEPVALAAARAHNPIRRYREKLIESGRADADRLDAIEADAKELVHAAAEKAKDGPVPTAADLFTDVFAGVTFDPQFARDIDGTEPGRPTGGRAITMCQAVNEALGLALERDDGVFLLGEDIADPAGGVSKTTAGLSTRFGKHRVRATPISEQAIVGAAIGAGMCGMKPVAEVMIIDFALVCMDQIANHAAKLRYMSGGQTNVPITIRMLQSGKVGNFGAQHSQSLEALFTHIPGLKVIMPSNAYDAKGLLLSCIDDPDPCIFIEGLGEYFVKSPVPEGYYTVPIGKAAVPRAGQDVTLIGYGWMMQEVRRAADRLAREGIAAEIVDLRTLVPLDIETVLASVAKTRRAVVVHSAVEFGGFGAELAACIQSELFGQLKGPVMRVGARYTPVAFSSVLEALHFPDADGIFAAATRLMTEF